MKCYGLMVFLLISTALQGQPAPLVSTTEQTAFWSSLTELCGKAFAGTVIKDSEPGSFGDAKLVMHVRYCSETEIQIPFHVGKDASRTWILTNTGGGILLKHDHRNEDGSYHESTMYGGHTQDAGWPQIQSFPADAYSKELFIEQGIPASVDNVWQMMVYPERFSYRLIRPAREIQVDFDLTQPITPPAAPWGYEN